MGNSPGKGKEAKVHIFEDAAKYCSEIPEVEPGELKFVPGEHAAPTLIKLTGAAGEALKKLSATEDFKQVRQAFEAEVKREFKKLEAGGSLCSFLKCHVRQPLGRKHLRLEFVHGLSTSACDGCLGGRRLGALPLLSYNTTCRALEAGEKRTKCRVPCGADGALHRRCRELVKAMCGPAARVGTDADVIAKESSGLKSIMEPQLMYSMADSIACGSESAHQLPAIRIMLNKSCRRVLAVS